MKYVNEHTFTYYSKRFNRYVTVLKDYVSDGATGAIDIFTKAWWCHDVLTDNWVWDDGTVCTNWQASWVLSDILRDEGHWFRCRSWFIATLLFGPIRRVIKIIKRMYNGR